MTRFLEVFFGSLSLVLGAGIIVSTLTIIGISALAGWFISKQ